MSRLDLLLDGLRTGMVEAEKAEEHGPPKRGTQVILNGAKYTIQKVLESGEKKNALGRPVKMWQVVVKRPRGKKHSTALVYYTSKGVLLGRIYIELWFPGARTYSAF